MTAPVLHAAPTAWPVLTADGRAQLIERISEIRDVRLPALRPLLAERERDERDVAEFMRLQEEAHELEALVASADEIVIDLAGFDGRLALGMRALVTLTDGSDAWVRPVHPAEAHLDDERISMHSPLARAILGARAGSLVWVDAPSGVWGCRVVEIQPIA
jgi:transcription elongation factor GreA